MHALAANPDFQALVMVEGIQGSRLYAHQVLKESMHDRLLH